MEPKVAQIGFTLPPEAKTLQQSVPVMLSQCQISNPQLNQGSICPIPANIAAIETLSKQ